MEEQISYQNVVFTYFNEDTDKRASIKYLEPRGIKVKRINKRNVIDSLSTDVLLIKTGNEKYYLNKLIEIIEKEKVAVILFGDEVVQEFKMLSKRLKLIDFVSDIDNKNELFFKIMNLSLMKRLISESEEKENTIKQLINEKNGLIGIAAHDLKNPINNILMLSKIIRDDDKLNIHEIKDFANDISDSAEHLIGLINELLDINKIDEGNTHLTLEQFDLFELIQNIISPYSEIAKKKNIKIVLESLGKDYVIATDRRSCLRIFDNLISNAIKFSPDNSKVEVLFNSNYSYVSFTVRDFGPGLKDEDYNRLFTKFAKLSAKPTGGESSTGLGLYITKKLVEKLKAKIFVESNPGFSTEFIVELPR